MGIGMVVSGGQTGVDRAALDVALELGLPYGGWCPAGGWAEDLPVPPGLLARYPLLREAPAGDPAERTRLNVRDSDATLVLSDPAVRSPGTLLTEQLARSSERPLAIVAVGGRNAAAQAGALIRALAPGCRLNVAGPRESELPGAYELAATLLVEVLRPESCR